MKKLYLVFAVIIALLTGCLLSAACVNTKKADGSCLYRSANVEVTLIEDPDAVKYIDYEWFSLTDEVAYTKNSVIVSGTASNVRRAEVSYTFMDTAVTDPITIFDLTVSNVIACRSGAVSVGEKVTLGVGYNMQSYAEGLPVIEEGKEYLIFCYPSADKEDDVTELSKYTDLWISDPKHLLIEKAGDHYIATDFFSGVPGAIKLCDSMVLSEEQILGLSKLDGKDMDAVYRCIEGTFTEDAPLRSDEAAAAAAVLCSRTMTGSSDFAAIFDATFIIGCSELEGYVRGRASAYEGC